MSSSDSEFSSDPLPGKIQSREQMTHPDLPSDADMINWIERRHFRVERVCEYGYCQWEVQESYRDQYDFWRYHIRGVGNTWRAAVELAMERNK